MAVAGATGHAGGERGPAAALSSVSAAALSSVLVFAGALAVGLLLVRPWVAGAVSFDTASSILYFERIVSGQILESFVTTTPKPLLTVIYGSIYVATGDFRAVAVADLVAYAAAAGAAWIFFSRRAGPAAGAFAAAALIACGAMLTDIAIAYAVPWAVLFWLIAAEAADRAEPRYVLAGLALLAATLVRFETIVVTFVVLGALALSSLVRSVVGTRSGRGGLDRRAWWLALGLLAVPVMMIHDWRLTGDPFYWLLVPAHFSAQAASSVATPVEVVKDLLSHLRSEVLLCVLATVGAIVSLWERRWRLAVGLLGLGPGIVALLIALALRHVYVSDRYLAAIDIALIALAAMSLRPVAIFLEGRHWPSSLPSMGRIATSLVSASIGAGLGLAAVWGLGLGNKSVRAYIADQRAEALHADEARPIVAAALDVIPEVRTSPPGLDWHTPAPEVTLIRVPVLERTRMAVALGLPASRVGSTGASMLVPDAQFLSSSRVVVHDRLGDSPASAYTVLEIDHPTIIGGRLITPLAARAGQGWWVLAVQPVAP